MPTVTIHDQAYEYLTWQDLGNQIFDLSKQIIESGEQYDRVIALAKGGLTFARSLVDYLAIPEVSSFQIEFYSGIAQTNRTPVITQSLPVSVREERVLVFDDVVDSGETMHLAVEYLKFHGVKSLTTCGLVQKKWTKYQANFVAHTTDTWVIFPNEARETIELLVEKWREKGDSSDTIKAQLLQIGFPQSEVALFAKLD